MARQLQATKHGTQPIYYILERERYSIRGVALKIGVDPAHAYRAARGMLRPSPEMRAGFSRFLNLPVETLFTEEVLAEPYIAGTGRKPMVGQLQ